MIEYMIEYMLLFIIYNLIVCIKLILDWKFNMAQKVQKLKKTNSL